MRSDAPPAPPLPARALLTIALRDRARRESVLGDLEELFRARVRSDGPRAARAWYRRQAWSVAIRYAARPGASRASPGSTQHFANTGGGRMDGVMKELRISTRSLMRSPGFTLPALLILATGMTAATAIFTVVDSIVFRPLDYPEADRLVIVCEDHPRLSGACIASPGIADEIRLATRSLSEMGIARSWPYVWSDGDRVRGVSGGLVTAGALRAVGAQPVLGRLFADDERGPDQDGVVILSHGMWTTEFGADPAVLGQSIVLDGEPNEIVGVMAPGFELPFDIGGARIWKPVHFDPADPEVRDWRGFRAIGRLSERVTLASASAETEAVYAGLRERYDEVTDEWRIRVRPLLDVVLGDARRLLLTFLGAAAVLLLIVCANVANLLLARGLGRRRELAVRAALGAGRSRLVLGILIESTLVTSAATLLAVAVARVATTSILALAPPIPRLDTVAMDARVLALTGALALGVTAAFAVLPALRVTRWNLAKTIRAGAREGEARGAVRLRSALVGAEVALSVVLLAGAVVLGRSFAEHTRWDPGFERSSLFAFSGFPGNTGLTRAGLYEVFRSTEARIATVPGVRSVAVASAGPLFGGGDGATPYAVEGTPVDGEPPSVWWFDAGPGYFATLGLPLVEGREFTEADGLDAAPVAVVNRTMAQAAWPEGGAIGGVLRLSELQRTVEVIGVVEDVPPLTPGEPPLPHVYFSARQFGRGFPFFLVRTEGDPTPLVQPVMDAVAEAAPDMSLGRAILLADAEKDALVQPRFQAVILGVFALVGLALSGVGVYAVVAYSVARRIPEMGVRMALGASAGAVVWTVFRSSLAVTLLGLAVGVAAALSLGRSLEGIAHGVSGTDPASLGGAALLLLACAAVAAYVPARRATRADPVSVMRAE